MEKKNKIIKILLICACFILIALAIYLPLKLSGALNKIDSPEELKQIIVNAGIYSYAIFFVIQFLQCVILPIPAFVSTVAGTLVFGPWITVIISFISIMLASVVSFWLGRKFGNKILMWVIGKEDATKWQKKLQRGKYVFFLMMLFPVFPDDILCIVVGAVTNISFKFFLVTNLITRPIAIICTCFLGSGYLIPFTGWGIPVWIVIVVLGLTAMILSFKYQQSIENFITKLSEKLSKKRVNNVNSDNQIEA